MKGGATDMLSLLPPPHIDLTKFCRSSVVADNSGRSRRPAKIASSCNDTTSAASGKREWRSLHSRCVSCPPAARDSNGSIARIAEWTLGGASTCLIPIRTQRATLTDLVGCGLAVIRGIAS